MAPKPSQPKAPKYYAVRVGRQTGVFPTWADCEAQIKGHQGASYQSFKTEGEARDFARGVGEAAERAIARDERMGKAPKVPKGESVFPKTRSKMTTVLGTESKSKGTQLLALPPPSSSSSSGPTSGSGKPSWGSTIKVYCDGASRGNGKVGATAGWGVYFADEGLHHLNESRRLPGPVQTNNRAELTAIIRAIQLAPRCACPGGEGGAKDGAGPAPALIISTDSQYSIKCITQWLAGWKRKGWTTSLGGQVVNKDLIEALDAEMQKRKPRPILQYVRGHAGVYGNEMADR